MKNATNMRCEIEEIPAAVQRLLDHSGAQVANLASTIRDFDPRFAVTVARGSSDHACTFLKYAFEMELGLPVASVGPSVASIYNRSMKLDRALCLAISQSGMSPDIVAMARSANVAGALSVAVTNDIASPLAETATHAIDICAGPERSVAATKTFVTSVVSGLMLLAELKQAKALRSALLGLPEKLAAAAEHNWAELRQAIGQRKSLFTLGRGPSWAMSNEAALKFKETCRVHAESYSSAEVLHGPVAIVETGFPVLCLASADEAEDSQSVIADNLAAKGATVFLTSERASLASPLRHVRTAHPLTDAVSLIVTFYSMVERFAADLQLEPDAPRHLNKVTETI